MPEYLSPGVYVEEVDAGPRPIAGVSTSTAGMVGVTARGPATGKPVLVTNFLEFQSTFGGYLPDPGPAAALWADDAAEGGRWWTFPLSVKGFFENGGQRLYVKRVVPGGATAASGVLGLGLTTAVTRDAAAGGTTVDVRSLIGFAGAGQPVEVWRGDGTAALQTTSIASYSASGPRVELADPLVAGLSAARGDHLRVAGGGTGDSVRFTAASPGVWGQGLRVHVTPVAGATLPLQADPGEGRPFVTTLAEAAAADSATVTVRAVPGLDPDELPDQVWVGVGAGRHRVTVGAPSDGEVVLTFATADHPAWPAGTAVQRVRRATSADGAAVRVAGASRLYPDALVQIDSAGTIRTRRVTAIRGDEVTIDGTLPAGLLENDRLTLVEAEVTAGYSDARGDAVTERLGNLRLLGDGPSSLVTAVNSRSQLVRAEGLGPLVALPAGDGEPLLFPSLPDGGGLGLADGDDGYAGLSVADFAGADGGSGARTGIVALEDVDEVAIVAVPGMWSGTVQSALIAHCEYMKDRFAILDPREGLGVDGVLEFREPFDTSYAALYQPWVTTLHPVTGAAVDLPPSGHVAGIYARVDVERGVHKAPANAIIRGIRARDGLAQHLTRRHQDLLNPRGINALRFFPGQGHRVWGARTLSSDPAWRYVNVRRLFLFLEESIDEGTQWVVFEPNAESLWALVRQTVENFLGTVWRSGALAGTTPDEAFFVACDRTTMTEDDVLNGRLICVVGVAPVHPAEFVVFRVQQKTRETQLA
ncbi:MULTISPECIES: phage tail sheath family protein [Catenuloplanes]|uniref:Phage tail sheath protein FI n=1 Tax=Catenuloplanes niger TaxID=587534 RepID=A0AAE4CXB7_9ACTN|nr:phage tail sheath subtilisin-like domain-containing protein [Catenuloplanes niger]MDR7327312.1 phage tail sheath protein FI [Catenuloplanes niger]